MAYFELKERGRLDFRLPKGRVIGERGEENAFSSIKNTQMRLGRMNAIFVISVRNYPEISHIQFDLQKC